MVTFVQDAILIVILTILGCFYSEVPYVVACAAGILLCLVCDRSLKDERSKILDLMELSASLVFSLLSGCFMVYLVLYQCRMFKQKYVRILLPAVIYIIAGFVQGSEAVPKLILYSLVLLLTATILYILSLLIEKYMMAKNQISSVVSVTAINEMYVKKLNQELVIKNYLADKNARLEERENISRNIHNSVGHNITAAIMTLDAADMLFDTAPLQARDKMNVANERIRTSLSSIRQAVRVLDSENKFVSIEDFVGELTAVVDSFVMDTMIKIHTDFEDIVSGVLIPHEHTEFLTGAVQELLSNGVRHGNADIFTVTVISDRSNLKVKVADNGKSDFGCDNQRERIDKGFGLKKLISYVKKCGGTIMFLNENGFKTEISLKLIKTEAEQIS